MIKFDTDKLKELMQTKGMTYGRNPSANALASSAGINVRTALALLNGHPNPTLGTISRVAQALDVKPWALVHEVDAPDAPED